MKMSDLIHLLQAFSNGIFRSDVEQ